jgi:hemolysin activation/secretion protein
MLTHVSKWQLHYFPLILALGAPVAYAQQIPSSADSGRIGLPAKPDSDRFNVKPVQAAKPDTAALSPEQAAVQFTLKSLTLHGATAFPEDTLKALYADKLSTQITMGDLYALIESIRQRYRDEGYTLTLVTLRQTSIKDGHIALDVVEGYVGEVILSPSLKDVPILQSFVHEVKAMRPLNTKRLERLMLVLNARPALQVTSILSRHSATMATSDEVTLTLQPKTEQLPRSFMTLDNHGSRFTGPFQFSLGTAFNNLGINYDDLFISGSVATQLRELKQPAMEYTVPVMGASGTTLQLSSSVNTTTPSGRLAELEVKGKSHSFGLKANYPVVLQRDESWFVGAGFTYRNVQTDLLGDRLFNDQLRVANLTTQYSTSDRWNGLNRVVLNASKGFNILGARPSGSADLSRADGQSDFLKTEFSATRLQTIIRNVDLLASARGQHTNDPLLSSEEFGIGGSSIGRGYDPSEITGDRGLAASIELRYSHNLPSIEATVQPYGFYDIGKVWNIDPSDKNHTSLASVGGGLRLYTDGGWNADILAAVPLTKAADEPPGYANGNSPRFLMSVRKTF